MRALEDITRAGRGRRASSEVIATFETLGDDTSTELLERLTRLKSALLARLAGTDLTVFGGSSLRSLASDVTRLVADAGADIALSSEQRYRTAASLGVSNVDESLAGAQLPPLSRVGLDRALVTAAFENTIDLLSLPMQQFATPIKVAVRGVALAGEGRMDAIGRIRDAIAGQGFESATYQAERIVRTEVSRIFNSASQARLEKASEALPFVRKSWRATHDTRTRRGHIEASETYGPGLGIHVSEPFIVTVYRESGKHAGDVLGKVLLMFPSDPNAEPAGRLAAATTINCRCNQLIDYNATDLATYAASQVKFALSA